MIERIIEYSVRNPFVVVFLALVVAGVGIHAVINTPIDAIPDLSENQVIVFADWPGRSPQEVEDQITYPLSVNLQGLAGVKAIRATSEFGFSMINIIFEDRIDFYFARVRVLERLSIADTFLPQGVAPYLAPDATALGQIFWYTVEGDGYDLGRLRAIQDWYVRYQLQSVSGVAEVASVGGFPIEYQIDVDPNKLRAYGVTLGEVFMAVERSNSSVGGRIIQKANSEYLVRSVGWITSLDDVRNIVVKSLGGTPVYVSSVGSVQFGSSIRRASLEKNGNEAVGGVVLMRYGENPLEVTKRIKEKIVQLQAGLPEGVRIVPFYERTDLIHRAIETVTGTLKEEMFVASLAILLILWHVRSALIVCITIPLAVLIAFILMRWMGIPSNIMSLSGIAISIGVLVDSSIVMVDNATHTLYERFGKNRVTGNTREIVLPAMRTVGRPIFFSVMIMVISFIPVFALGGMEGRMFHPLAWTKTFALVGVSILAITLVPALIPLLVRGRVRHEEESWIVRSVLEIYRPVLRYLLEHPWPIVLITGLIFIVGAVPIGIPIVFRTVLLLALVATCWFVTQDEPGFQIHWGITAGIWILLLSPFAFRFLVGEIDELFGTRLWAGLLNVASWLRWEWMAWALYYVGSILVFLVPILLMVALLGWLHLLGRATMFCGLLMVALSANQHMDKLGREFMPPLDEGTILDMPVTVPRASITQVADDLKARDALLRSFPEVSLVVGKAGRAETPTDPAPPDMVETVVNLRPREHWPKRELRFEDADAQTAAVLAALVDRGWIKLPTTEQRTTMINDATMMAIQEFDQSTRDMSFRDYARFERELSLPPNADLDERERHQRWSEHVQEFNWALFDHGVPVYTHAATDELLKKASELQLAGDAPSDAERQSFARELTTPFADNLFLWRKSKDSLLKEMDTVCQVPGWGNIWTQPIINRVDMLATGVRTMIGVKVYGDDLNKIQEVSQEIAAVLKQVPGAADVFPDQIVGEGYLEITIDREKAARYGVNVGDIQDVVETALGGRVITMTVEGRERFPVRVRYARAFREDEQSVKNLLVAAAGPMAAPSAMAGIGSEPGRPRPRSGASVGAMTGGGDAPARSDSMSSSKSDASALNPFTGGATQIPLSQLADVRIVPGPSMIKSENGLLRAYVQLNVRDRDIVGFVEEAQRTVAEKVTLPAGMYIEWSGQFEHQLRAKRTLTVIVPIVVAIIFVLLYITYNDFTDASLMMLAVPGAVAGGVLFQYLFGFNFSVAVWVGFIACFGLATETGVVMLVYLREAVEKRGGLENIESLAELKDAIMQGAVHRLRPKLLTEGTTIIGLAPMLWATGTGAEIMQPMAAPVLGGILVADEVIDLLLPVLFYHVRARRWRRLHKDQGASGEEREDQLVATTVTSR
jgi:Cu/Ag efflux pump CusA